MTTNHLAHAEAAYRKGSEASGKFIFVLHGTTGIEGQARTIETYLAKIAEEFADSLTNVFTSPSVRFIVDKVYDMKAHWEHGEIVLTAAFAGADYKAHGKKARNRGVRVSECKSFADALNKAANRSRLVCKALGSEMTTYLELLTGFKNRPADSSWFEFDPAADVWPKTKDDTADAATDVADVPNADADAAATADATADADAAIKTVIVEPVEVEHDGVVDVEMAETTEIPAVTAETPAADAVSDDYRQYIGMWASADGARAWVGADGAVWVHFDHPDDDYESWVKQDTPNGAACAVSNAFVACGWTHLSAEPADDVPRFVTDSGAAKPGTVCADDFERGWRYDGLGAVTRDYAAIPAPRAVQSSPALPAECEAVTTVIPEVPPTTNSDAHVLAVSDDVIPTIARVRDVFPDVPYRAVHAIRRVVENSDGTVSKKKVAYVFRHGDEIQVLRRDRYENAGRDAAVEAEIAARVARLQRAA